MILLQEEYIEIRQEGPELNLKLQNMRSGKGEETYKCNHLVNSFLYSVTQAVAESSWDTAIMLALIQPLFFPPIQLVSYRCFLPLSFLLDCTLKMIAL